jgi:hypothetical protein
MRIDKAKILNHLFKLVVKLKEKLLLCFSAFMYVRHDLCTPRLKDTLFGQLRVDNMNTVAQFLVSISVNSGVVQDRRKVF